MFFQPQVMTGNATMNRNHRFFSHKISPLVIRVNLRNSRTQLAFAYFAYFAVCFDPFIQKSNNPLIQGSDPCASVPICGLNDYVNSANSVKTNHHTLVTIVYSNMPFSNCPMQNALGQFHLVVKTMSPMSYANTRQSVVEKIPA